MKDQLHAPLVEAFAKQGYHILCEKPMATTIEECVDMVKQVQASEEKKIFGVGHGTSFDIMAYHIIISMTLMNSIAILALQPSCQAGYRFWSIRRNHQYPGMYDFT